MTEDEMVGWHHRLDGQEFEHPRGPSQLHSIPDSQRHVHSGPGWCLRAVGRSSLSPALGASRSRVQRC